MYAQPYKGTLCSDKKKNMACAVNEVGPHSAQSVRSEW